MYKLILENKYEIRLDENFNTFKVLRYGEDWRDLIGDNFVLALVKRIQKLEREIDFFYEENAGIDV